MLIAPEERRDALTIGALGVCAFLVGAAAAFTLTHLRSGTAFLFGEDGNNLLIADTLARGGRLYRDVFTPYGPAPAFYSAAVSAMFGLSPLVYLLSLAAISGVNVMLVAALARRALPRAHTILFTTALLPLLVIPGSLVGGFTFSPYVPLERTLLLAVALLWRPPEERSAIRAWALGATIGSWQLVRFGGVLPAAAALVAVDLVYLFTTGAPRETKRRWLVLAAYSGAAIVLIELAIVASAFALLPYDIARDVLWPAFMFDNYSWVTPDLRWPGWIGWRAFVVQYLPVVVWLAAAAAWRVPIRAWSAFLIPFWFYLLAAPAYFRHVNHFRQFAWALAIPSAASFALMSRRSRAIALALCVPALAVFLRSSIAPRTAPMDLVTVTFANGATLSLDDVSALRLNRIMQTLERNGIDHQSVMFLPYGSGWYAMHGFRPPMRHGLVMPGFVRGYEVSADIRAAQDAAAVVICPSASGIPGRGRAADLRADARFKEGLARSLDHPIAIDSGCAVYLRQTPRARRAAPTALRAHTSSSSGSSRTPVGTS